MARFGELEAAIMNVVWAAEHPLRVREIRERLHRDPPLAYTTVQTVTEILHRKGWLVRERDGRAHRYTPAASREDYVAGMMNEALSEAGDRTATLVRFLGDMDRQEIAELRAALNAATRRKPTS
jgi:predicted transcriptional regulator